MSQQSQADREGLAVAFDGPLENLASVHELCDVLQGREEYEALEALLDRAARRWPREADLPLRRGHVRMALGRLREALDDYQAVLALDPQNAPALCAMVRRGQGARIGGLARIEAALAAAPAGSAEARSLNRARALLLEEEGQTAEAFDAFRRAAAADADARGIDLDALLRAARSVIRDIRPESIDRVRGPGHDSAQPVFIVGMPRSGTTLTEQFVSAHPRVFGAGEHMAWSAVLNQLVRSVNPFGRTLIEAIDEFDPGLWHQAGDRYLAHFGDGAARCARLTNKLPANFNLLPFVRLVFPNARVLHLSREPLAVLCSCLRQDFAQDQLALSLEDWARYYGIYAALMESWTPILGDRMLTMRYEELVQDFPRQARAVVDFLGLPWDSACLHPEENPRAVTTASIQQVREPVHAGAIDAWRRYEAQLRPLLPLIDETRRRVLEP